MYGSLKLIAIKTLFLSVAYIKGGLESVKGPILQALKLG